MKPASFTYHDPTTIEDALQLMAEFGDQARPLAGGQSLVPLMNFRLVRPAHLIDLNHIDELRFIQADDDLLRIGAMTRQRQVERSDIVARFCSLLREATALIGHVQIRNRGTIGGSLAHAFPSAELPVAMVALDASFVLRSTSAQRTIRAGDFFLSYMTTVLDPGEILAEIQIPALPSNAGSSYQEVSRRHGDFALAGVAAVLSLDASGAINRVRLTLSGATPIRAEAAENVLLGEKPSEALFRDAARRATENLEQDSDLHASAEYRRSACAALAYRALAQAAQRAAETKTATTQ